MELLDVGRLVVKDFKVTSWTINLDVGCGLRPLPKDMRLEVNVIWGRKGNHHMSSPALMEIVIIHGDKVTREEILVVYIHCLIPHYPSEILEV
jgi:hypothetical protein